MVRPYLDASGFGSVILILVFKLRADLISALVERWRPKTHTFQFSCGECTITLGDAAMQLGLLVVGDAIIGSSQVAYPVTLYYDLLGCSPGDGNAKFTSVS